MSVIRGTSLAGFPELVAELGGDLAALLQVARIPRPAVGDHDSFLDWRQVAMVLEVAATTLGTPDLGRQLALRQGVEILGPVGVAVRTAETLGAALTAVGQYMSVYSPAIAVGVEPLNRRQARFRWGVVESHRTPHTQAAELAIGVSRNVMRLLLGADFVPTEVLLGHQPLTPVEEYVAYFGCPVRFGAPVEAGLTFPLGLLQRPLASDSEVHDVVRAYLTSIVVPSDEQELDPARVLVRRMLPTGALSLDLVAAHLAVHPRTLQRRLAQQGTSFAELLDDVRREEASRLLRETDLAMRQVAGVLGFSEQSVLSRACRRWFDASPSAVRAG